MADQRNGGIAWCDETWNPIRGCSRVSPGCGGAARVGGCYAEKVAGRFCGPGLPYEGLATIGKQGARWTGEVRFVEEHLRDPLRWRRPRRVFVNSMSDLFHEKVSDEHVARIFAVMAEARHHTFQVLTKRADRMRDLLTRVETGRVTKFGAHAGCPLPDAPWLKSRVWQLAWNQGSGGQPPADVYAKGWDSLWPLPNVILGVTAEDQQRWDERVPHLLRTPAATRMVSVEPQLEMVRAGNLLAPRTWGRRSDGLLGCNECCNGDRCDDRTHVERSRCRVCGGTGEARKVDWVIQGGESGPGARHFCLDWAHAMRTECATAGVAYFFKQTGSNAFYFETEPLRPEPFKTKNHAGKDPTEWPADLRVQQFPEVGP